MTITLLCGNTYHLADNRSLYLYIFRSLYLGTCIPRQLDRKESLRIVHQPLVLL